MPELKIVQLQCDSERCQSIAGTRKFVITFNGVSREVILCKTHAAPVEQAAGYGMPISGRHGARRNLTDAYMDSKVRYD